jgi:hypothetical protein
MLKLVLAYLLVAPLGFFLMYSCRVHKHKRAPYPCAHFAGDGWKFTRIIFAQGGRMLVHDYARLHCPWSWKVARQYRLAELRALLADGAQEHILLGRITASDCDDPAKQERLARACYVSRTRFWLKGLVSLAVAPVFGGLEFTVFYLERPRPAGIA